MNSLRAGQETVLSWPSGAMDCRVIAAAGCYVLLRPGGSSGPEGRSMPGGACSLTYLDGMIPMGWDGVVEVGAYPGELRFRVTDVDRQADRRSAVRLPVSADVQVTVAADMSIGQLLDVSAGGLRFRLGGERLERDTLVRVRCELPNGGPEVDAHGLVRTSEQGIASVEFTAMHGASAQAIGAWTVAMLRTSLTAAA